MVAPAAPVALARDPALPPAQDFDTLKSEAVALLQQLCGGWTDYNAHDPGVTLVELLSYALTDLGYRATLPVEDLLAAATLATRGGIYPPWRALPSPPVTLADFRRLLLDRVHGLANAWLTPRTGDGVPGLYDIRLHAALPLPGVHPEQHPQYRALIRRTRRVFERNRPLCEDIGSIRVLRPRRMVVHAALDLDHGVDPEAAMAEALFRLALALAPEPRRSPLEPERAASALDGPLLLNGLIAAGELTDKPATIDPEALAELLHDIPGVLRVADPRLWVEGTGICDSVYSVDRDEYCSLDAGIEGDALPLELSIGGRPCRIDRGDVLRRLLRRWDAHRAVHPLKPVYRKAFTLPQGRARALTQIARLGPQLPRVYGLADPDKPRNAAAAQLDGFLRIFETMMSAFCARLVATGALVAGEVPPMLSPGHHEKLLDLLLTLYGVAADDIPLAPHLAHRHAAAAQRRIAVKQRLLDHRAVLAKRRGRGFDTQGRGSPRRDSGIAYRLDLILHGGDGRRRRFCLVEHNMLRPRTRERRERENGQFRYAMAVSAVIRLDDDARQDDRYRADIEAAIRAELPAHLGLHLHFVDPARWRRLRDLEHLWRAALRLGEHHAADQLAMELRDMLERWSRREPPRG
ncbi:hypothetical protein [Sphingomonas sp. LM7]|uniref:hypothetical protein n=1 Tax=Sphingomonas sp. LM7 TaxID=1938607 RepID=UPI0009838C6A|nr:hypothetical protein [Sphingomonas sp. LM7]AQR73699.1 hypothetical protein BXU08_08650 [Sphingomonas sp. LM7]